MPDVLETWERSILDLELDEEALQGRHAES